MTPETAIYQSNSCGPFVILRQQGNKVQVKFLNTGFVRWALHHNCMGGKVRDPYARIRYGVGYMGESYKRVPFYKKAHQLWSNVLKRCYSEKDPKGYLKKGVRVDDRWLNFSHFLEDLPLLEGFDRWLANDNMRLDKDRKGNGTIYSREACMFLTEFESKSQQPNYRLGKVFDRVNRVWVPDPYLNIHEH